MSIHLFSRHAGTFALFQIDGATGIGRLRGEGEATERMPAPPSPANETPQARQRPGYLRLVQENRHGQ